MKAFSQFKFLSLSHAFSPLTQPFFHFCRKRFFYLAFVAAEGFEL
jgi:hypothetical protein